MDTTTTNDIGLCRTEEGAILCLTDTGQIGEKPIKLTEDQLRYLFSQSGKVLSNINP